MKLNKWIIIYAIGLLLLISESLLNTSSFYIFLLEIKSEFLHLNLNFAIKFISASFGIIGIIFFIINEFVKRSSTINLVKRDKSYDNIYYMSEE